jgi:hypothetical protein
MQTLVYNLSQQGDTHMGTFKLKSLEQKMKKAGLVAKQQEGSRLFYVEGKKGYYGSYFTTTGFDGEIKASCVSVCPNGDESDAMFDYYPQTFCSSIKRFIDALA